MAVFCDKEFCDAYEPFRTMFPNVEFALEGWGLSADETIALMNKSVETGTDYLTPSSPEYPEDADIA